MEGIGQCQLIDWYVGVGDLSWVCLPWVSLSLVKQTKNLSECMTNLINSDEKIQTCLLPWDVSTPKQLKQCSRKQYAMKGSNMSIFAVSFLEQSTMAYKQCPGLKFDMTSQYVITILYDKSLLDWIYRGLPQN